MRQKYLHEGLEAFDTAVRLAPKDHQWYLARARCRLDLFRVAERRALHDAKAALAKQEQAEKLMSQTEVLALRKREARAAKKRGGGKPKQRKNPHADAAYKDVRKAVDLEPNSAFCWNELGTTKRVLADAGYVYGEVGLGLPPIATPQCSSPTSCQVSYHIR
jgi:tetratricopeptide (TPR) repeat protein